MGNQVIDKAFEAACEAAKMAGEVHRQILRRGFSVERKQGFDIVTAADTEAETVILNHLKALFPDHSFSSEEARDKQGVGSESQSKWRWIIDPLDGTVNYANGIPLFSVSLALQNSGDTILGVVYDPTTNTMYTSKKGNGAFKDVIPIYTSKETSLNNSVLSFMLTSHYTEDQTNQILRIVKPLAAKTRGLRLWVSQALELASIAEGRLQGTVCIKSRGFSAAAGALLIREAGGQVTDLEGEQFGNGSRSIVATNGLIHDSVLNIVKTVSSSRTL